MTEHDRFLAGRHALVTGSSSGIGLGIARALASAGADLTLNGFGDPEAIETLRSELERTHGVTVAYHGADMRVVDEIEDLVASSTAQFGRLDILVNNAGIQHVSPIDEFPVEQWNDIIAINLSSSFHTIRCALPRLRANGWGRILNVASAHALRASPFKAAYVAAKHGLAGLTKTVALETAQEPITVNAIGPGYVETPLVTGQVADTARARGITEEEVVRDVMLLAQPSRRLVAIEEVAALALFLCREEARSMTGTILPVDGGWTAK